MKLIGIGITLVSLLFINACGPVGPIPGGKLSGTLSSLPKNWDNTLAIPIIQLETHVGLPQSYNIWTVTDGQFLYVAASGGIGTSWVKNLLQNPTILVKVGGQLYALKASRVNDSALLLQIGKLYAEKYDLSQIKKTSDESWVFKLDAST